MWLFYDHVKIGYEKVDSTWPEDTETIPLSKFCYAILTGQVIGTLVDIVIVTTETFCAGGKSVSSNEKD